MPSRKVTFLLVWCLAAAYHCPVHSFRTDRLDPTPTRHTISRTHRRKSTAPLFLGKGDDDRDSDDERLKKDADWPAAVLIKRFISPRIDDPFLPCVDASIAQIVAPTLQIYWLSVNQAPSPTWLRPIGSALFTGRGSLVAPTLIHGAALATCWILGALAARAYEKDAIIGASSEADDGKTTYNRVLLRVFQAGAFSTGILILSTQLDLFLEFKRFVQPGESDDIDFRLLTALIELLNDVFFEAVTIVTWRLFLARQNTLDMP